MEEEQNLSSLEQSKLDFEEKMQKYNIPKEDPFYMLMSMMQEMKTDIEVLKEKKIISKEEIAEALSHGIGEKIEDKIVVALDGLQINAETAPLDYKKIAEFTSKVVAEHVHNALTNIFEEKFSQDTEMSDTKSMERFWHPWIGKSKPKKEEK